MTAAIAPPGTLSLRFSGRVSALTRDQRAGLLARDSAVRAEASTTAARVIADVRARGDAALIYFAQRFDGVRLSNLEVPRAAVARALDATTPSLRRAMERAARNIEAVHRAFAPSAVEVEPEPGIVVGRRPDALERVGLYAPGGRAAYPSSVLMMAIPARVAGVREVVLASPPSSTGLPAATVLAAAAIAGVDRVFAIGGAGAIAALALGTQTVPRVDRIVGPGNSYVTAAKLHLAGEVGIDSPAGPSELVVIADDTCDPESVAAEMLAQAEHDPSACALALVVGAGVALAIEDALQRRVSGAARRDVISRALAGQGGVLLVDSIADGIAFANEYAPEHLLLATRSAGDLLPRVRNAGTVLVGTTSSVVFGDYMTGANHVLPTGGSARAFSGLSPLEFVRWTTYQRVSDDAGRGLAEDVAVFAESESLFAHADAARLFTQRGRQ